MKKLIKRDVYNICNRIKQVDKSYMLAYDFKTNKYNVYSKNIISNFEIIDNVKLSYVCVLPYNCLDERSILHLYSIKSQNIEALIKQIDNHNEMMEKENRMKLKTNSIEVAENTLRRLTK